MDETRDCYTEWSKLEKDKYHMISFICGLKKNDTGKLVYRIEKDS